jgi:hypothetical protein
MTLMFTRLKTEPGLRKGTMHYKIKFCVLLFLTLIVSFPLYGEVLDDNVLPYKKNLKEKIFAGEIFSESKVTSKEKTQELHFTIAGLHQKSCEYALKKLSLYENYSEFLDFVKTSQYNEQTTELNFLLSHPLLPYNMRLTFKLPRITKTGVYPFTFDEGILKNLKGNIYVINHQNRCLFFSRADWVGPDTKFPNIIFEFFSQTLAKMTMERLFRLSNTLSH